MIGKTLSHYRLLEKIGEGGMGVVYRAEDTRLRRTVALKFLRSELTLDGLARERFLREARAAAALDHPHICTVYEIDEAEGQVFIAMAFVEGQSLKQLIAAGRLSFDDIVRIATHVAEGLKAAHDRGIVHRDIKPANIMLTPAGQVRIMDFGLAKLERATDLTTGGTLIGTAPYMSPEQARGEAVDHRSDIWSLGCVIYEMLAGRSPVRGDHGLAVLHAVVHDEPPPVTTAREHVPAHVARVVHTCLQKDAARRYARMDDLLADLTSAQERRDAAATPSIAVLPFVDMSPGRDQEYFGDGIAEELINGLAHIKDLRVVARTSAFAFKGQTLDVREIGRRLNVRTVLEGSIRKSGNRLRITAQLIDRSVDDIFEIQDEVAAAVIESLRVKLLTHEKAAIEKRHTNDPEAYALYLRGNYFYARPSVENLERAIACYQQAVERDPSFALALIGIAGTYASLGIFALSPPRDTWLKVREFLERAVAIDSEIAEAHVLAGTRAMYYDRDWDAADRSFRRALALNPGNAMGHATYAWFCTFMGRFDEAVAGIRRAMDLDPLMPMFGAFCVGILAEARRFDEAIAEFHKAIELDPHSGLAYFHVGTAYLGKRLWDKARAAFERSLELTMFSGWAEGMLGFVLVEEGRKDAAEQILQAMLDKRRQTYLSPVCIAALCWKLGKIDQALEYFDRALDERDTLVPLLNIYPFLDDLHREPRFQAFLERLRFPSRPW
jgi:TolB-like protein/Tfp pilus assembly protein PilF/predicted Ser/Thr protein kinase